MKITNKTKEIKLKWRYIVTTDLIQRVKGFISFIADNYSQEEKFIYLEKRDEFEDDWLTDFDYDYYFDTIDCANVTTTKKKAESLQLKLREDNVAWYIKQSGENSKDAARLKKKYGIN